MSNGCEALHSTRSAPTTTHGAAVGFRVDFANLGAASGRRRLAFHRSGTPSPNAVRPAPGLELAEGPLLPRPTPSPRWSSKERLRTFPNVVSPASQPRPNHLVPDYRSQSRP